MSMEYILYHIYCKLRYIFLKLGSKSSIFNSIDKTIEQLINKTVKDIKFLKNNIKKYQELLQLKEKNPSGYLN